MMLRAVLLGLVLPAWVSAQGPVVWRPLRTPGSVLEEVQRLQVLVGDVSEDGALLRSAGWPLADDEVRPFVVGGIVPTLHLRANTSLPWGGNDGALRAGRGWNAVLTGGAFLRRGRVSLVVAPQLVYEANRYFPVIPWDQTRVDQRSMWAHPYLPAPESADWPLRFGTAPRTQVVPGQSRLAIELSPYARVGLSTENRWWGPGAFNALLLSANAPGFVHGFVEMPRPWRTRAGAVEAQYLLGALRESPVFDRDPANDRRSLSAVGVVWHPAPTLAFLPTVGLARAVMAAGPVGVDHLLDAIRDVGRPVTTPADIARHGHRDQITELFLRWAVPEAGVAAYAEWARYEFPGSLRDYLEFPGHTQGYTVGFDVATPAGRQTMLHVRAEATYTEPSTSLRVRPTGLSYTSAAVPQGWTHEGQMLGPFIGPGGSSQHLAADWHGPRRRVGLTLGRIRWLNGPLFTDVVPGGQGKLMDVSLFGALRAAFPVGAAAAQVELTHGVRLAYLNQALLRDPVRGFYDGVDFRTWSLAMTLTPSARGFFFRR
ncbi:MAG: hypothetical protein RL139_851 [Gemmatimonadota bacterium]|jgi:Capsule assembly protein Wzi